MLQVPSDSIRLALRRVFEDPAYRWVMPPPESWLHHWYRRLIEWIREVSAAHPLAGDAILLLLIAILVVIAVHGAFIVLGTVRRATAATEAGSPVRVVERRDAAWHRRLAQQLMREGRYAEALMEEFWAVIAELESRRLVAYRPAKTPGEYLLDSGLGAADRSALGGLIERLYPLVFAGRGCRAEDVAAWRQLAAREWGRAN